MKKKSCDESRSNVPIELSENRDGAGGKSSTYTVVSIQNRHNLCDNRIENEWQAKSNKELMRKKKQLTNESSIYGLNVFDFIAFIELHIICECKENYCTFSDLNLHICGNGSRLVLSTSLRSVCFNEVPELNNWNFYREFMECVSI